MSRWTLGRGLFNTNYPIMDVSICLIPAGIPAIPSLGITGTRAHKKAKDSDNREQRAPFNVAIFNKLFKCQLNSVTLG